MTKICPLCGKMAEPFDGNSIEDNEVFWDFTYCKVCGRFELSEANDDLKKFNRDHLMSYLVYNGIHDANAFPIIRQDLRSGVINGEKSLIMVIKNMEDRFIYHRKL